MKAYPNNLYHPSIQFTDPDTLQFCVPLSETLFWYCEFDTSVFCGNPDSKEKELYDKYCGYPNQLLKHAQTDPAVRDFINNHKNWISETIDVDDIDNEDRIELYDTFGISPTDYDNEKDRNQIIAEMYFETNINDFR